ncbi:amino acid/amide ABC transporter substrate-binding protein (HAAT family) [Pseudacidovorax intermedius]|uniref:Amino acid/amide ABC transporter substrate-binding protein (HAAT family) n=1 Tax=Pseudacidovorax intermedius TaxID=433924 RepID=A0A370FNY5_9BURK|nr:ABC transporter substrate-binding protein [Pseudacidovorax intermedius]RDI29442.1 amino acid/amide ABC transporter substrate-binding protein (HAAT family) [Pseudacidovorax intermedius]
MIPKPWRHALTVGLLAVVATALPAAAQEPIRIGEINSYKALPQNLVPYRNGWLLAQEEINAAGGVLGGRKLETLFRDDNANPGDAVRMAEELIAREKIDILSGVTLSHVGVALADFARQKKMFFLASGPLSDKVVWENGNRYTYRLRSGTYALATSVVAEAAKLGKKRWALIYPNYEYGQAATAAFKEQLKKLQPDVEFVADQAPPLGKIDAGAVVQAIADAKPDAIFNVMFGSDLTKLAREGKTRGLFQGREVVSLLSGEPEYLDPLKDDAPEGWIVTGYPYTAIDTPEHRAFYAAYQKKYGDYPRLNAVVGYATVKALAAGIQKAGGTDTEKLIAAFKGLNFSTPFGPATFRPQDNQSTMGIYVGRTAVKDGKGVMPAGTYIDGSKLAPPDDVIRKLRN